MVTRRHMVWRIQHRLFVERLHASPIAKRATYRDLPRSGGSVTSGQQLKAETRPRTIVRPPQIGIVIIHTSPDICSGDTRCDVASYIASASISSWLTSSRLCEAAAVTLGTLSPSKCHPGAHFNPPNRVTTTAKRHYINSGAAWAVRKQHMVQPPLSLPAATKRCWWTTSRGQRQSRWSQTAHRLAWPYREIDSSAGACGTVRQSRNS